MRRRASVRVTKVIHKPKRYAAVRHVDMEKVRANAAKHATLTTRRAHRYARAFGYFQGRPGWTSLLTACLLREKRLRAMEWMVPAIGEYLAEAA
jgi:hypothetical protein